jgi:hypothetical protein
LRFAPEQINKRRNGSTRIEVGSTAPLLITKYGHPYKELFNTSTDEETSIGFLYRGVGGCLNVGLEFLHVDN